jgi:arylformamidase
MSALYRNFTTKEELDAQYDVEGTVPDFLAYANDFVARSADYRTESKCLLDVPYGATGDENYDVFLPAGESTELRPALFFVHGGYWRVTTSKVWSYLAKGLCDRGFVVVITNYALCPGVTVPEIDRQHRAAFAHFYSHASGYDVDTNRIVIAGHSVGGHAVGSLVSVDWEREFGLPAKPFVGALPVSGVFDIRPLRHTFLNEDLHLDNELAEKLSVNVGIPSGLPPMVIAYGTRETDELARQSVDFAATVREAGNEVELRPLENNHFDILESLADGTGFLASAVIRLSERG